jgi:hypothetical protein
MRSYIATVAKRGSGAVQALVNLAEGEQGIPETA